MYEKGWRMSAAGRIGRGVFWAATWGVGAAIGVAVGGWLTAVGGAGAPGVESLELAEDLIVLPALAGLSVFGLHIVGQVVLGSIRRLRSGSGHGDGEDDEREHGVGESV